MFRPLLLVSFVALLILGRLPDTGHVTVAQAEMPRATSPSDTHPETPMHPIVGAWRWDHDLAHPNTRISYGVFHADGIYEEVTTGMGMAVGAWQAVGKRTVVVTMVFQDLSEDPAVVEPGTTTIRLTADVQPSGNVATASFSVDTRMLDGTLLDHSGPFVAEGSRIAVENHDSLTLPSGLWSYPSAGLAPR